MFRRILKRTGSAAAFALAFLLAGIIPFLSIGGGNGAVLEANAATTVSLKSSSTLGDYIELPKSGETLLDLSDKSAGFSFRVFDDGGASSNYSASCSGTLFIRAKSGFVIQVTGSSTVADKNDIVMVLDGESATSDTLYSSAKSTTIVEPVISSGNSIGIFFYSNASGSAAGIDFTVKLYNKSTRNGVNLSSSSYGKLTAPSTYVQFNDTVTVTATPNNGYVLKGITATDADGRSLKVSGGTWQHNTATFKMPLSQVTVNAEYTNDLSAVGGISLNIPATGNEVFNIPSNIHSFKVYDEGGPNSNYGDNCSGSLTLKAPSGYRMQIFGTYTTEEIADSLYVYNSETEGTNLKGDYYSDVSGKTTELSTISTTSNAVTLKFVSDSCVNYSGIDLTVVVFNTSVSNTITCTQAANGSFTCDKTSAKNGDTVTLNATPSSGYVLNRFIVTNESGKSVSVDGGSWYGGNTGTFTMGVLPVRVTAEFVLPANVSVNIPASGTHTTNLTTAQTEFSIYDDGGAGGPYSNGCNGILVLNAPTGYAVQVSGTVKGEYNKDILEIFSGDVSTGKRLYDSYSSSSGNDLSVGPVISSGTQLSVRFSSDSMNNNDGVVLNAKLVYTKKYYDINTNSSTNGIYYTDKMSARCNDKVTITLSPNDGYYVGSVTVKDASGNNIPVTGCTWNNLSGSFIMPASAVTISVQYTSDAKAQNGLSMQMPADGTTNVSVPAQIKSFRLYDDGGQYAPYSYGGEGVLVLTAPTGYKFSITGTVKAEGSGHDYLSIYNGSSTSAAALGSKSKFGVFGAADNVGTVVSTSNAVTLKFVSDSVCRFDGLDLVVTLVNNEAHSINCSVTGKGTLSADKTSATEGTKINLTVTPNAGYHIKNVKLNLAEITPVSGAYSFVMPSCDAAVTAEFEANKHTITYKVDGSVYKTVSNVSYGSTVTAIAAPTKTGYTFSGWQNVPSTMPDSNVTITGTFSINKYTITFNTNGGTSIAAITQNYGTAVTAPADPTRTGYTFAGWDKTIPTTMPAQNMTIKASWTINQYTITFNTNGGTSIAAITQNYGTAVTAPADPTRTGYTFAGWNKTIPSTMPAQNMTITAKWTAKQYTITFNTNGGTSIAAITQDCGTAVTAPANPTKTGYTFAGWDKTIPTTMPAQNMTITAKWTINQYTITFNTNGGTSIAAITQNYGTAVTAPANPTKTGYTFAGWNKTIPTTMPAQNTTITAKWTVNQYTITFNTNGGTSIAAITQDYGTAVTAPANPTRTGYTFAGWNKTIPTTMPAQNTTITAKWTAKQYTITFNTNGGTSISAITQDYGTAVTAPANPTKTGYTFAGWDKTIPATMPAQNTTITAKWTINQYTITFNTNGGTSIAAITQNYGTAVTAPADPTKTGYTFAGWNKTIPTTMLAQNTTITAKWTVNQYTITFNTNGGTSIAAITQNYGTAVTAPVDPTRTGYTFAGWNKTIPTTMPAQNTTITAKWTVNQYTITFNTNGGSAIDPITQNYGTAITKPADPTRSGYSFGGWDKTIPSTMPAQNMTINAKWTGLTYTITFNTDGGSAVDPITQESGTAVTAPADPTKTGYTFADWDKTIPATMPAQNMTIKAKWTVNKYTITFNTNGGTAIDPITQNYGTTITKPADPTKSGYTFGGWDKTIPTTMPAQNLTITAKWTINQYTITFNTNGGTSIAAITQNYGTTVTAPSNPTKTGYTFAGWDKTIPTTMPAQNTTITAKWTVNKYTITFNTNGGTAIDPITQNYGTTITKPADPTKSGYTFGGWDKTIPSKMPAQNMTITAVWTSTKYTITFNTDGGTAIAAITQESGTAVTAPADPTKTGYTFAGWDKTIPATMPAQNMTITAKWTVNKYTITFNTNGGSSISAITQNYGTAITKPADPTKSGYTFGGWDKTIPSKMPAQNMTVNAIWTGEKHTITFNSNGGSAVASITQDCGTPVSAPANPTRTGYTFIGWDKTIPETMPAQDMTITAKWRINQYTITFNTNGGTSIDPITQNYGTAVTKPADPVKQGSTFNGWDKTIPSTMPAKNMTINALWTGEKYTITFDSTGGSAVAPITQEYGTAVTAPANPTKAAYIFNGWDRAVPATMPAENITLYATWKPRKYTITFNTGGGSAIPAITQEYGSIVTSPADPTRTGYDFIGWDVSVPYTMPAKNMTITALWQSHKNTITYIVDNTVYKNIYDVDYGTKIVTIAAPKKTGYSFSGWKNAPETMPDNDIEITGTFKINKYTITFDSNGGTAVASVTQNYDTEVKAPAAPTRTGFTFAGWNKTIPSYMPAYNTTITAKWTINRYTLTFDTVGGTKIAPITQNYATLITQPKDPTRAGFTFAGWETKIPKRMQAKNMTIKAKWTKNKYTISFNSNGGTSVASITQDYATLITAPKNPTRTGFIFAGWEPSLPKYMQAKNMTLKAKWTARTYTITFDSAGGTAVAPIKQKYATLITPPKNPTRTGFTFAGWDTKIPKYMQAKNMTIKAKWTKNKYTISFNSNGGTSVASITQDYATLITAPKNPTRTGFIFAGWEPSLPKYMQGKNMTLKAKWTARTYTLTFDTAGGSEIAPIKQKYATVITPPKNPTRTGFIFAGWDKTIPKYVQAKNMTFKAKWTPRTYTLTFDTAGGTEIAPIKQKYATVITPPKNPTRTGFIFAGWDKTIPKYVQAKNMTFKAKWTPRTYTLTFDTAGGTEIAPIKQKYATLITPPKNPTRAGYTFVGWDKTIPKYVQAKNMTFTAIWKKK